MAKYNKSTVDTICKLIEQGMLKKDAAILGGISEPTFYRWLEENDSFKSKVEASLIRYKQKLIDIINVNSIKDGKLALEILARRFPQDFTAKQQLELINPAQEIKRINQMLGLFDDLEKKDDE